MDPRNSKFEDSDLTKNKLKEPNLFNSKQEDMDPLNSKFEDTNLLNSKFENMYGKDPHENKLNSQHCVDVAVLTCKGYGSLNF